MQQFWKVCCDNPRSQLDDYYWSGGVQNISTKDPTQWVDINSLKPPKNHLSHEKNPGWLDNVRDYTTQLYRDYNNPLEESLLTNQYNGK